MPETALSGSQEQGLVWIDPKLANQRSTHVLVAGVGRYNSKAGVASVGSPCVSARNIAQWFLDGANSKIPGFLRPAAPLGSLALLLSEPEQAGKSQFAGEAVPACTFSALKAAVASWVARGSVNPKSSLIMYMASHGASAGRRSGVLCEDFRQDDKIDTGIFDIEQFAKSLGKSEPADKLLIFDCCRTEIKDLDEDETLGLKLFSPPDNSSKPDRPVILYATAPGEAAYGRDGGATLFGDALQDALNGLATSGAEQWRIGSVNLGRIAGKILSAQRQEEIDVQRPDLANPRDFTVALAHKTNHVTVVARVDIAAAGEDWTLETQSDGAVLTARPAWEGAAFTRLTLPQEGDYRFVLKKKDGSKVGVAELELAPPGGCYEIPDPEAIVVQRTKSVEVGDSLKSAADAFGDILLEADKFDSGVVDIMPADEPPAGVDANSSERTIKGLRAQTLDFNSRTASGNYRVSYTRVDGKRFERIVKVNAGDRVVLNTPMFQSDHEWLREVMAAGLMTRREAVAMDFELALTGEVHMITAAAARDIALGERLDETGKAQGIYLQSSGGDRFREVFFVFDDEGRRFNVGAPARVPWALASLAQTVGRPKRRELAFLPTLGGIAGNDQAWRPMLLAAGGPAERSAMVPFVDNARWQPLIAFLGRRDFPSSRDALERLKEIGSVKEAMEEKVENPLAAAAAGLVAVACGDPQKFGIPDQWLENLAKSFPDFPDGMVILGRWLWTQARKDDALVCFREALARGIPAFSLSVDWLAEGLETLDEANATEALRWSRRVDPKRAFTVLRLAG